MFVASKRDKDHPKRSPESKDMAKTIFGNFSFRVGRPGRAEAGLEAGLAAAGRPNTKIRDFDGKTARKTSNRRGNQ